MGCCLLVILSALWPRVVLVLIYFFAPWIPRTAFHTALWPLLGFIFLPTTALAYELTWVYIGAPQTHPLSLILVIIAFIHDLAQLGVLRRRH